MFTKVEYFEDISEYNEPRDYKSIGTCVINTNNISSIEEGDSGDFVHLYMISNEGRRYYTVKISELPSEIQDRF